MQTATAPVPVPQSGLDSRLALLEQKLALLIAHTRSLRRANASLGQELAATQIRNNELTERLHEAGLRLDALLARLPEAAE
jgi:hypothetical protein